MFDACEAHEASKAKAPDQKTEGRLNVVAVYCQ